GRVAVLHSGLSDGERYDAWKSIRDGKKDMVIGTRSAVFAPFPNLGLIVLDEEHEHSYKSESSPRYHARDIARFRCAATGSTLLFASATPSLESFSKAKEGKYKLVTLSERYGEASLPEIVISDMRGSNSLTPIGDKLYASLSNVLARNEQAILFINRRGYNNFLSCPVCGKAVSCPHCSVSYTYHSFRNNYNRGYLYCHYCGNKEQVPSKCPSCGNDTLTHVGFGTQMIEEELNRLFPSARVLRMDSDSMSGKMSYDALLGSFRRREADILVGTQMVTKGHDFPDVTLVGVINADGAIYQSSYSASERAFSLFTQVIGRAGRAKKHGQALLQTYSPDFPLFGLVAEGNYEKMYDEEIALRRALSFPPFCNLAVISMSSTDEGLLLDSAHSLAAEIRKEKTIPMTVFGPIDAPIYKINGVYHTQIVIKCVMNAAMRSFLAEKYAEATEKNGSKISVSLDVDPMNL
ncbi:MAG: primosomal protein N', partial [Firmicutes bacterium]|nr:primosomal protein N' [Candidatus Colimorpha enterica]